MAGLADQIKDMCQRAQKGIELDSAVDCHRFIEDVVAPKMRKIASYGGTSMTIPHDLPYQNRVGEVVESPTIGTYLEYDFDNNDNYTFLLFRHLERYLIDEGFNVSCNAANTPYLTIRWD